MQSSWKRNTNEYKNKSIVIFVFNVDHVQVYVVTNSNSNSNHDYIYNNESLQHQNREHCDESQDAEESMAVLKDRRWPPCNLCPSCWKNNACISTGTTQVTL